ncbi:sulfotransferase [Aeromicrobium sp.]|uniref:sulfotransferase family protein n=1 Tax=Aeromicrobium sp. TaxID=1871063 RepID=UPI0028AC3362|nr:sulfotransferase [Aeromicrobium sp.]
MSLAKDVALKVPAIRRLIDDRDGLQRQLKSLKRQNADLQQQKLDLDRELRVARDDREFEYVFIVTYGRTGSTLLQGLLNSIPGYLIRGENAGTLESLHDNWRKVEERLGNVKGGDPTNPWFGMDSYSPEEAAASYRRHMQQVFLKPGPDTRVTGFKEIRWWRRDLVETLEFTRTVFPGARFVLNTRNAEDVIQSKWWAKKDPAAALAQVADYDARLERAHQELGSDVTYRVHYDDYVADHGVLEGLFEWLGESFDRQRVDEVMGTRHSVG